MASNRRGRIKERFVGIHKGFDWVQEHCSQCLALIQDKNPQLTESIQSLAKATKALDDLTQEIYSKL